MSAWPTWLPRPQTSTLRKILFQVHLWTGVALGLYVLLISVSGTVLVYRVELSGRFSREPAVVAGSNARLPLDELKAVAQRAYPQYEVLDVTPRRKPNLAVEVMLRNGRKRMDRLFNPFTGQDIGDAVTPAFRLLLWLVDFHANLSSRSTGQKVNGVGAVLTTLLCLSGALIWWPGSGKWRSRLTLKWKTDRHRLNWALHNALGFWSIGFVLMWGVTGIYLCFPEMFNNAIDYFDPVRGSSRKVRLPDRFLFWMAQAHFGRFGGYPVKIVWTVFGILPMVLFVTGMLMWWHRVLRPIWWRGFVARPAIKGAEPEAGD
jgi:uncharacterized iron-regulated membrane protein